MGEGPPPPLFRVIVVGVERGREAARWGRGPPGETAEDMEGGRAGERHVEVYVVVHHGWGVGQTSSSFEGACKDASWGGGTEMEEGSAGPRWLRCGVVGRRGGAGGVRRPDGGDGRGDKNESGEEEEEEEERGSGSGFPSRGPSSSSSFLLVRHVDVPADKGGGGSGGGKGGGTREEGEENAFTEDLFSSLWERGEDDLSAVRISFFVSFSFVLVVGMVGGEKEECGGRGEKEVRKVVGVVSIRNVSMFLLTATSIGRHANHHLERQMQIRLWECSLFLLFFLFFLFFSFGRVLLLFYSLFFLRTVNCTDFSTLTHVFP